MRKRIARLLLRVVGHLDRDVRMADRTAGFAAGTAPVSYADECERMRQEQELAIASMSNIEPINTPFARARLRALHVVKPPDAA